MRDTWDVRDEEGSGPPKVQPEDGHGTHGARDIYEGVGAVSL